MSESCAKRRKGVEGYVRDRTNQRALSSLPRRCKSSGGSSGKSNNGGAAPRFEQSGVYGNPGKRSPLHGVMR